MSPGISSLMTANVFMLGFKPANDWDKNIFLQPFTDVKIGSKSTVEISGRMPVKSEHFLYILHKAQPVMHICVIHQQEHYLDRQVCGLDGILSKMIPLWKLEKEMSKVKIFIWKKKIKFLIFFL